MTSTQEIVGFRLSQQQQQLWRLREGAGSKLGPMLERLRIDGPLDIACLEAALKRIARRHEALRTRIELLPGTTQPIQVIHETTPAINLRDFGHIPFQEHVTALIESASDPRYFCLSGDPLHIELVRLSPNLHYLMIAASPLCCDFASLRNFVGELAVGYSGGLADVMSTPTPVQYVDYAAWQEDILSSEDSAGAIYWRREKPSDTPITRLPLETCADCTSEFDPAFKPLHLSQMQGRVLADIARHQSVALEAIFLAAWAALLQRHSGLAELQLFLLSDGRSEAITTAIGAFELPLPLKVRFEPDDSFCALMRRLQSKLDGHRDWQDYARTQKDGNLPSAIGFGYRTVMQPLEAGPVLMTLEAAPEPVVPFSLYFQCLARGEEFDLALHFDRARFSPAAIECFAEQWSALLASAAREPNTPVARLELLSASERESLMINGHRAAPLIDDWMSGLHSLLERQAEIAPRAIALRQGEVAWTYSDLNRQADILASHLIAQGLQPEDRVALLIQNPLRMIAAIFAVLKAGGAYVPLDMTHPVDRLAFMVRDAAVTLVLTEYSCVELARATHPQPQILDDLLDGGYYARFPTSGAKQRSTGPSSAQLAYLIYTSGSTGQPKGVAITHGAALQSTLSRHMHYPERVRGFLLMSSFSFDSSVAGLFWTISQGGCLCLPTANEFRDADALAGLVERHALSHLLCLPSLYALMLDHDCARLRTLQVAIVAGESCTPSLRTLHYDRLPDTSLYNEYGPTEATVWCSFSKLEPQAAHEPVFIGRPISGARIMLLDERLKLVPRGVVGEIFVGGPGLARGYLGRPDLTAERFVPDPIGSNGERLYRTGDLARYRADGNIEFLGRIDHQVKIRGFRIELGEIEAALTRCSSVREAAVVAIEDRPNEKRIVAYVVGFDKAAPDVAMLRATLQHKLPDYMIPSAFVVLKSLPVTPNGKVDRKALPAPDTGGELARAYVPPRTPTEELLSKLWAEALGLGQVGIRDNFFALGGHSLLATQMISQIRAIFEINLPLQRLWERPTIAALAQSVNSAIARGKVLEFPPLARVPRDPPPPLSIAQEWIWSLSQEECGNRAYNIPAAVRMLGRLDTMALEVSLRGLVQRHEILRTTFPIECGKPVQKIAPQIDLSYSRIDLSGYHAEDREIEMRRILEEEAQRIFDLAHGPLLRVFLLVLGERDHVFALMLHHIVTDGWSTDILIRDFAHLYSAALRKEPSRLPELRVQYADYSCWQQNWMTGLILEDQLAYWRSKLDRAPAVLELATDRPRAPVQTYRGATLDFEVSTAVARCLHALARAADATLFMILLGAFKVMLMRYSGKDDLCVGTWTANRIQANVEDLIGLFADTQALRTDLSGDPTFRTLLERVRKTVLEAQVHHELPFEKLVQELRPEYDPSRHPLFQVMFVLQNSPLRSLELPELHVAPLRVRTRTARFDLTLAMMERETGLVGEWEYNTDLFDEDTAARMLRDYVVLLDRIVANPESSLSELTCFSEAAADSGSSPEQYVSNVSSSVLVDVTASCSKMK